MERTVKLYRGLAGCGSGSLDNAEVKRCLPEGLTARELIEGIEISQEFAIVLVNGENIVESGNGPGKELHDGDVIQILPSILVGVKTLKFLLQRN